MARRAGPSYLNRLDGWRKERAGLARRDAQSVIERLLRTRSPEFPLGDWLNLVARAQRDSDLATLCSTIDQQFQTALERRVADNLAAAPPGRRIRKCRLVV